MKKVLLVVNPSSGGEQAKEFEQLAIAKLESVFDEVVVLHTKKAGDAKTLLAKRLRKGIIVCLSWAEMEQSTKESVESLNKNIGQISDFSHWVR